MSMNLAVPKTDPLLVVDPPSVVGPPGGKTERKKTKRAKSPSVRNNPRAKSKSPNPSFCSVLSRVKDWELGAFTPKTALPDNVDVMNRSHMQFSDSDKDSSPNKDLSGSDLAWKPSPTGSPVPEAGGKPSSALLKNALNSNLGRENCTLTYFAMFMRKFGLMALENGSLKPHRLRADFTFKYILGICSSLRSRRS